MKKIILPLLLLLTITVYGQQRLRVSILGDSYSTYQYYIPEGNEPWYFDPVRTDLTDVSDVRQTWWWQVVHDGGFILEKNDSYSGSTICYTGYNDDDYSPRSFITRLPRLGSPDIILIFGNTNDQCAHLLHPEHRAEALVCRVYTGYLQALWCAHHSVEGHQETVWPPQHRGNEGHLSTSIRASAQSASLIQITHGRPRV